MKPLITSLFLFFLPYFLTASTFYVMEGGTGDGSSWATSSGDLAALLQKAQPGDMIWVAQGVYRPTTTADRTISFVIKDGIQLYGGFKGGETSLNQRSWNQYITILSGEIGEPGVQDNSYNVLYSRNVGPTTIVDGVLVTGGNANGSGEEGSRVRCGGAWYMDGSNGGHTNPKVRNCTFQNNKGRDGGAIYCFGIAAGECSPTFLDCTFLNNHADLDGGSVYTDTRMNGNSHTVFKNCHFEKNQCSYGGGIFSLIENGKTTVTIKSCRFSNNTSFFWGGGIFNMQPYTGQYELKIEDCEFDNNYPTDINKTYFLTDKSNGGSTD